MDNKHEIKNLDQVLQLSANKKIIGYTTKQLTAAGDNYGSLMLALEVTVEDIRDKTVEVLPMVAKMCPENEWIKEMFKIPVTFKKENAFYQIIVPTLQKFQNIESLKTTEGVKLSEDSKLENFLRGDYYNKISDIFPMCYGSRISLDPSKDTVDDDAVLFLENLKINGFSTVDCMTGFDLNTTKIIIKDLALFHGVPLAFKLKHPDLFQKNIMPHLQKITIFEFDDMVKGLIKDMVALVKADADTTHLADITKMALERGYEHHKKRPYKELFATIIHNDYWVNNTMIKFVEGTPVKNKLVDFQLVEYGSPANDVVFFLFTSIQKRVLDEHYDEFINIYYETLIKTLEDLNCDTKPFTLKLFLEEIEFHAKYMQFYHSMVMLKPIYTMRDKVKDLRDITEEDMSATDNMSPLYAGRLCELVRTFAERNWL